MHTIVVGLVGRFFSLLTFEAPVFPEVGQGAAPLGGAQTLVTKCHSKGDRAGRRRGNNWNLGC